MRADRFWNKTRKKISIQGTDMAGFDKLKVECFNCHNMGHFARECRAPRSQDRGRRENYRQGSKVKEQAPKALMEIDRVGRDWSYMANDEENHALIADEETPTEFALVAKTSVESEVFDNSLCSTASEHRNQELKYCEKIRILEFKTESRANCIESLTKDLELLKKEKGELETKLTGFQTASKDLDSLLESQRLDKNKEGLGYSAVPPPPLAQVYSSPKKDMSWTGLPEFKDDTANDSPTKSKTDKVKTAKKPSVKYAEQYRKPTKKPNGSSQNNIDDKGYWDSGCSRHMIDNISYLSNYEPFDEGYVSFGQGGCKITGKGNIITDKLEFENVYFLKDIKDFKLLDDANVLLRTPRQHNMYSIDLNNSVPHKDLTCLVAKASVDEGMLWYRRLGHLNFKTMNRLVRHNLVRGLPSKSFENNHTCTACLKGKQHKASSFSQVESRLAELRNQELKYYEKIRVFEFKSESSADCIESLKKELELIKKEKDGLDTKLTGFQTASKDLDSLLESQRLDKNKEGLGYNAVSPPPAQIYSPPKKDISWTGLPECADDTVTDYSRPAPTIESFPDDAQNRNPSVTETEASPSIISPKPFIKFVKANDSPTKSKTYKVETAKKPPIKYAEQYIKPTKKPNGSSKNNVDDKGYWDSGCSRHMTGNISYLSDYEPFDRGYVSFGQRGCKITGKGTIKTGKLEFENVYFVKDLKYNLFSVSQICDNKNSVLFTDLECSVLGQNFKLSDDDNVLLRTPRQHNMYSIDLNNIVPHKDLTCLVAKASADECILWHRRLEFLENKAIEKGAGPNKLFDIDSLTKSMDYVPVDAGTNSTNLSGTKDAASQEVKKDVSSLRYIALPNWVHDALLESSSTDPLETLIVETPIPSVSSPVPTACFTDSQEPSSDKRLISKRVANQVETPSLDNILTLTNRFEDILRVTTNSVDSDGVEADTIMATSTIEAEYVAAASCCGKVMLSMPCKALSKEISSSILR
nr:ribonuclease H-like domain-containing protein [Tanacetum cinerariifolium]